MGQDDAQTPNVAASCGSGRCRDRTWLSRPPLPVPPFPLSQRLLVNMTSMYWKLSLLGGVPGANIVGLIREICGLPAAWAVKNKKSDKSSTPHPPNPSNQKKKKSGVFSEGCYTRCGKRVNFATAIPCTLQSSKDAKPVVAGRTDLGYSVGRASDRRQRAPIDLHGRQWRWRRHCRVLVSPAVRRPPISPRHAGR